MKKLLVMLLALTMVMTMAVSLVACGGDDETSSTAPATSTPATSSTADTTVADTTEASTDDTTEASSAVDATTSAESESSDADTSAESESVDSSDVETSDVVDSSVVENIEYKTTPTKTNYALKKTYTVKKGGLEAVAADLYLGAKDGDMQWADDKLTKLTDGVVAAADKLDTNAALSGTTVQLIGSNAFFEYIFDLGDYYGDISKVVFRNVRDGKDNGNNRGFNEQLFMAYVGDSLTTFSKRLATTFTSEEVAGAPEIGEQANKDITHIETFNYTFAFDGPQKGRFVKLTISSDVYVLQLDEIEIWNQ